ncbi:MAG: hypothetical protein RMK32_07990, partial [Anaerolineae bacterium]|nr:hypothetical protein [Anaerolineae bacterium]
QIFHETLQKLWVVIFIDEAEALLVAWEIARGSTVMRCGFFFCSVGGDFPNLHRTQEVRRFDGETLCFVQRD